MDIKVDVKKKIMPPDKDGNEEVIINYVIAYPDHNGKKRFNTEDEIRKIFSNFQEVIKEIDKWHELNPEKEGV